MFDKLSRSDVLNTIREAAQEPLFFSVWRDREQCLYFANKQYEKLCWQGVCKEDVLAYLRIAKADKSRVAMTGASSTPGLSEPFLTKEEVLEVIHETFGQDQSRWPPGRTRAEFIYLVHKHYDAKDWIGVERDEALGYLRSVIEADEEEMKNENNPTTSFNATGGGSSTAASGAGYLAGTTGTLGIPAWRLRARQELQQFADVVRALKFGKEDKVIRMPQLGFYVPIALRESFFVPSVYRTAVKMLLILNPGEAQRLTGTPGIGKSTFALFLICHLAKLGKKIIYSHQDPDSGEPHHVLLNFTNATPVVDCIVGSLEPFYDHIKDPEIWRIIDGLEANWQWGGAGRCIVISSSHGDDYSQFDKGNHVKPPLHMKLWSMREMEDCRAELYKHISQQTVRERFAESGGLVRYVLSKPDWKLQRSLERYGADAYVTAMRSLQPLQSLHHSESAGISATVKRR